MISVITLEKIGSKGEESACVDADICIQQFLRPKKKQKKLKPK